MSLYNETSTSGTNANAPIRIPIQSSRDKRSRRPKGTKTVKISTLVTEKVAASLEKRAKDREISLSLYTSKVIERGLIVSKLLFK